VGPYTIVSEEKYESQMESLPPTPNRQYKNYIVVLIYSSNHMPMYPLALVSYSGTAKDLRSQLAVGLLSTAEQRAAEEAESTEDIDTALHHALAWLQAI